MRILHVLDHSIPLHSGYSFRTRAILNQQRALGYETYHVTGAKHALASHSTVMEEDVDGWHFYRTAPGRAWWRRLPLLNQWDVVSGLEHRLLEVVRAVQPDILHAHSPALNGLAALRVGRRLNLPVVYEIRAFWEDAAVDHGTSSPRGLRYRLTRALETYVVRHADAVTTICEGLRRDLQARGVAPDKLTVIPNAVDAELFSAMTPDMALRERLGLGGRRVLGFIGSFYAYEGLELLLYALPKVLQAAPDVRLLLVGGGPEEARLRQRAQELGLTDAVVFAGRVPHDQVNAYYGLIDVCVYPRLRMRLTELVTPLKPLEAMAQSRLVIASDIAGHRELIIDGVTGVLFPAGDASSLAQTLTHWLATDDAAARLRTAGRAFVVAERTWAASVARYQPIYARLCGAPAAEVAA